MITFENTQLPSPDDISFESLEYLFGSGASANQKEIPWVEIKSKFDDPQKEIAELKAQIRLLMQQAQANKAQMQRVCIFIGYMQGLLQEKEELLKQLPDLRFKAAQTIGWRQEVLRSREKIEELEAHIDRLSGHSRWNPEEILKPLDKLQLTDELAIEILMWLGFTGLLGILYALLH